MRNGFQMFVKITLGIGAPTATLAEEQTTSPFTSAATEKSAPAAEVNKETAPTADTETTVGEEPKRPEAENSAPGTGKEASSDFNIDDLLDRVKNLRPTSKEAEAAATAVHEKNSQAAQVGSVPSAEVDTAAASKGQLISKCLFGFSTSPK